MMQLKKLEMCGFKSFANRTEIIFNRGVTAIVGPNGCGKSNVVDAIKWVLGTLSYKAVRGGEMLDVIFKGATGVSAMGFAEVSLTLDNSDHTLPVDFSEVTITRRLTTSGEGEYFINRAPCRLKDIRELLYGTGIGTDNYSIIEQGKIDKLVLSNPHERRLVFDEAAGISKYRARKREAENRLDRVSQDLLRIREMGQEIQRQLRSAKAQAGRATRYKELTEELKEKRQRQYVHEHRALEVSIRQNAEQLAAAEARRQALRTELAERMTGLEACRRRLEEEANRNAELSSALAGLETKSTYLDQSLASAEGRRQELEQERQHLERERAELESKLREVDAQAESEERNRVQFDSEVQARTVEMEEFQRRCESAEQECASTSREFEERKAEAMELAHKGAGYRNSLEQKGKELEEFQSREAEARQEKSQLEQDQGELSAKIVQAQASRESIEREVAVLKERHRALEEDLTRLREEKKRLEWDLVDLRGGRDRGMSRSETLRDLEEQLEGLDAGAQDLLRERPHGILGTVADFLEVSPEDAVAIEVALGARAGAVVFETAADTERAADLIREREASRTVLLSLDACRIGPLNDDVVRATGALGRANQRVRVDARFQDMVDALLGRVLVVPNAERAREIRRNNITELPLVTLEGDLYGTAGLLTTRGAKSAPGLISRKSELRRLEEEVTGYLERITERENRLGEVEQKRRGMESEAESIRQGIYEKTMDLRDAASKIERLTMRLQTVEGEIQARAEELETIDRQSRLVTERRASLETLLAKLAWLEECVKVEIRELEATLTKYRGARDELRNAVSQAHVERAKACEKRSAAEKRLEMLSESRNESTRLMESKESRIRETAGRLEAAAGDIRNHEAERESLAVEIAASRQAAEESTQRREALRAEEETARNEHARVEAELHPFDEELTGLKTEEASARVKMDELVRRAREEDDLDLAQAAASLPEGEETDLVALRSETDALRTKIASYGTVNLGALEQVEELEERDRNYRTQQEDLDRSRKQLEDFIRTLNKESQELFNKTIESVRENFSEIFRKVFGGGKADIIVETQEGVDMMEQGLEIMARPPGKELTTISLLSGGEKSLTAIALVMALFRANPSPFCLLDEADAALDEKNVERYAGIVREFSSDTQFIVITHNKRTMAVADDLYGVTMEQQGVSKKVSVSLEGDGNLDLLKSKAAVPAAQVSS